MAFPTRNSRDSRSSRGRKIKLSQRGDPQTRPMLTRLYGLIGCLIVSLSLIVLLIILEKKLPDGSKSNFHIPVRRDLEPTSLEQELEERQDRVLNVEKISPQRRQQSIPSPVGSVGPFTPTPTPANDAPKLVKREETVTETVAAATTVPPTFVQINTCIGTGYFDFWCYSSSCETVWSWGPCYSTCLSSTSLQVGCKVNFERLGKRQYPPCDTTTLGSCSSSISSTSSTSVTTSSSSSSSIIITTSSSSTSTSSSSSITSSSSSSASSTPTPTSSSSIPTISSKITSSTPFITPAPTCIDGEEYGVICYTQTNDDDNNDDSVTVCESSQRLGRCSSTVSSTSTSSSPIITPTPTCVSGISLLVECTPHVLKRMVDRPETTKCFTLTLGSCSTSISSTSSSSPTTSSSSSSSIVISTSSSTIPSSSSSVPSSSSSPVSSTIPSSSSSVPSSSSSPVSSTTPPTTSLSSSTSSVTTLPSSSSLSSSSLLGSSSSPRKLVAPISLNSSSFSSSSILALPSSLPTISFSSLPIPSSSSAGPTSASGSASDLLQSIEASGSLAPTSTGGGGGGRPSQTPDPKTITAVPDIFPISQTILGDYTPLIVGRGFLMLLNAMYHKLEMYEPIRQLLIPGGGSLVDFPAMIPIQIAIISAQIGTGFSAGATFFDTSYCNPVQTNPAQICPPKLSVNPAVVDIIITTLVVQVLTILYMIQQWWKKPGGFSADPTSIAGIAAFMGHPEVEQEFIQLPTEINSQGLKRRFKGKKFRLGQFATERGIVKYGIMPADDENKPKKKDGFFTKLSIGWLKFQSRFTFLHNWKKNRFLFDALFVLLLLGLLGLAIDAVSRVHKTQVVFLATAAASGTGWRIFTTMLGVIVSYYWGRLFRDAQTFAPYIDLGRGTSSPDATILLKRHSIPLTAVFPLLWHCHYTPASVAFIGLIAELLIVALSGLPYRPGQSRGEFLFWGITSLAILTFMIVQLITISIWRRKLPHLPRAPESIASVMTYVAGTSMTRDFNGLEQLKRSERDQAIRDLEKSYAYGWRREEDGRVRWIVDVLSVDKNRALMDGASEY